MGTSGVPDFRPYHWHPLGRFSGDRLFLHYCCPGVRLVSTSSHVIAAVALMSCAGWLSSVLTPLPSSTAKRCDNWNIKDWIWRPQYVASASARLRQMGFQPGLLSAVIVVSCAIASDLSHRGQHVSYDSMTQTSSDKSLHGKRVASTFQSVRPTSSKISTHSCTITKHVESMAHVDYVLQGGLCMPQHAAVLQP